MEINGLEVVGIQRLPKTCCTLQFQDFVPFVQGLSVLKGWEYQCGKALCANSQDGVIPVVVKVLRLTILLTSVSK